MSEEVGYEIGPVRLTVPFHITSGVPPVKMQWSDINFHPEHVIVTLEGGELERVTLSGPRKLKGGRLGSTDHSRDYWKPHRGKTWDYPEWVERFVEIAKVIGWRA